MTSQTIYGGSGSGRRIDDTLELATLLGQTGATVTLDTGRTYTARSVAVAQGVTLNIPASTVIEFTDNGLVASSSLTLNGVTGVTIQGDGTIRGTSTTRTSVYGLIKATDSTFLVDGITLHTSPATGVWSSGGTPTARNLTVHDTAADGIHFSRGATNFEISDCLIYDCGDDGIGIVAYAGYPLCDTGSIDNVTIANIGDPDDPDGAGRGIAVAGTVDTTITNYTIAGVNQAGIIVTCAPDDVALRCSNITIGTGSITTVGQNVPGGGVGDGIYITTTDGCSVIGASITNTPENGIEIVGSTTTSISQSGNSFSSIGGSNVVTV